MITRTFVAAALVAATAVPAAAAASVEDHDSRAATSSVAGVLTDDGGAPLAGRRVLLLAWPPDAKLRSMPTGAAAALVTVDGAATDRRGRFLLKLATSRLGRLSADRVVDFTVLAPAGEGAAGSAFSFSRRLDPMSGWVDPDSDAGARAQPLPAPIAIELAAGRGGRLAVGRAADVAAARSGSGRTPAVRSHLCRTIARAVLDPEWVPVGEIAATRGSSGIFKYKRNARSSLGAGISYDFGATFSTAGSRSQRSEDRIAFPVVSGENKIFLTQFRYRLWEVQCRDSEFTWIYRYDHTDLRVHDWVGGAASHHFWPRDLDYCNNYEAGSVYERDRELAVRYRPAFKVLGLDLSARTGFSRKAKVRYSFHRDMSMCGDTDFAPHARRIGSKHPGV